MTIKNANKKTAVIIPCRNESSTIEKVISDFKKNLPFAEIWVCDNASSDDTYEKALKSGVFVVKESKPGKGNAMRKLFNTVKSDFYLMVDGDDTYDASDAPLMISKAIAENADMITARRREIHDDAYRKGHRLGNNILTGCVRFLFKNEISDMLSGYRVLSSAYVDSFPCSSNGFEIETEMTIHAVESGMNFFEIDSNYKERPIGSFSKLKTFKDGIKIASTIFNLTRHCRPLFFFGFFFIFFFSVALLLSVPIFSTWMETGLVPRFPTAILSTGLALTGFFSLFTGLILSTLSSNHRDYKRIEYIKLKKQKKE